MLKEDFGLTTDELLVADDRELRQIVSLKKLAPYRKEKIKVDKKKVRQYKEILQKVILDLLW